MYSIVVSFLILSGGSPRFYSFVASRYFVLKNLLLQTRHCYKTLFAKVAGALLETRRAQPDLKKLYDQALRSSGPDSDSDSESEREQGDSKENGESETDESDAVSRRQDAEKKKEGKAALQDLKTKVEERWNIVQTTTKELKEWAVQLVAEENFEAWPEDASITTDGEEKAVILTKRVLDAVKAADLARKELDTAANLALLVSQLLSEHYHRLAVAVAKNFVLQTRQREDLDGGVEGTGISRSFEQEEESERARGVDHDDQLLTKVIKMLLEGRFGAMKTLRHRAKEHYELLQPEMTAAKRRLFEELYEKSESFWRDLKNAMRELKNRGDAASWGDATGTGARASMESMTDVLDQVEQAKKGMIPIANRVLGTTVEDK